ncbi:DsbA family protein [Rhizorhabdus wittichii]
MQVDYYFDFMSPYAYLAGTQLPRLIERYQGRVRFVGHSFDMWAARLAAGNTGPSNREIPAKSAVLMADVARWARRYGVPIVPPKGFDTVMLNRAFYVARDQGKEVGFMTGVYARLWGAGGDPADPAMLLDAAQDAGLDPEQAARDAGSAAIAARYDQENREAQARGIFGAPMFVAGDQTYWGNDRIAWLEEQLDAVV